MAFVTHLIKWGGSDCRLERVLSSDAAVKVLFAAGCLGLLLAQIRLEVSDTIHIKMPPAASELGEQVRSLRLQRKC